MTKKPTAPLIVTEPVYLQMTRVCRERAAAAAAGDRFPSERELADTYRVSRATANKVISNLVAEGLLAFRPGIGTFVQASAKTLNSSLREMESFTGHARALGLRPETRVLAFERTLARSVPAEVRHSLALGTNAAGAEPILYFERLRLADGEPVILERRWCLASVVPGLTRHDLSGSFYALLEDRYRFQLAGERHRIRAANATASEAATLGCRRGAALLAVEGPGFDAAGRVLWHQILLYRGDKYELQNAVQVSGRGSQSAIYIQPRAAAEYQRTKAPVSLRRDAGWQKALRADAGCEM